MNIAREPQSLREFYPYYRAAHADPVCAGLHHAGCTAVLLGLAAVLWTGSWAWLLALPVVGYGFAWAGHFFAARNIPLTFHRPLYSFICFWWMYFDWLRGRRY